MKEIPLESGAVLNIGDTPFAESKELFQAMLRSGKANGFDFTTEQTMAGSLLAAGFTSPEVEKAMWVCLGRCTYGTDPDATKNKRITKESFESADTRVDFVAVCVEVAIENIGPFTKGLYAVLPRIAGLIKNIPIAK